MVSFKIQLTPSANMDLQEAYDYYEGLSLGLGERFISCVEERLEHLSITPFAGPVRYEDVRCTMVSKFPFMLHYLVNDDRRMIIILRIFHTSQKPLWEE